MDPFKGASGFGYNPGPEAMGEADGGGSGLLDIYVHHARNIHNICIYANQDVYAKFSLTCSPEEAVSTGVAVGGGKNPRFDERLKIRVDQPDAVLKCEIWMMSRAKTYMEDQLLGFALVPLSLVAAAEGKLTQDFTLSSTDLFHSPAGTVRLTLSFDTWLRVDPAEKAAAALGSSSSSITSEVVLLAPADYGRIEFPDMNVAEEDRQMVSEYFDRGEPALPFLHLGASPSPAAAPPPPPPVEDYEMTGNSSEENNGGSDSPDGSIRHSGPFSNNSTTTSLSDDRTSADSMEKKNRDMTNASSAEANQNTGTSPDTPTSKKNGGGMGEGKKPTVSSKEEAEGGGKEKSGGANAELGSVFKSPLGSIDLEAEQSAMQQQIVDMYKKSMQQFTESLAKMKLPMNLDNPRSEDGGAVIQSRNNDSDPQKKKDKSRVFYGSRAFF